MQLTGVRLTNIACFEDVTLDFTRQDSEEPAPWIVLLGENGTGKSTILQMIGAALLGSRHFLVIAGDVDWRGYIREQNSEKQPEARLELKSEHSDEAYQSHEQLAIVFNLRDQSQVHSNYELSYLDLRLPAFYGDRIDGGWFASGYSSWRRLGRRTSGDNGALPTLDDGAKPFRFASLFGGGSGLTDVSDWLAGLYFRTLHPDHTDADQTRFESATASLLRTLPQVTALKVTQDRQVVVTANGLQVPLERLSDGYRGTIAWIGDLIRRLFDAYPESENPLRERGVVLVDEIDLHLHPRWQRSIVEDVRKLFPNLQFIVTSHSPFVAQDLRPQDRIIVLERSTKGRSVVAREDAGSVQNWSADQILSGYFGLPDGTRGEDAQRKEARYAKLLDAEAANTLTKKTARELNRLRESVNRLPIGDTEDEEAFFQQIERATAAMTARRRAIEAQQERDDANTREEAAQ